MSIRTAVVLAGGLGTRLRSLVSDVPKPMAPIAGRPFLEYLFDYWIDQGVERFVLSVGYRHEAIVEHFAGRYRGATLHYAREPQPLGTGGGLLMALEHLTQADEHFLLLNGDTWFALDLARFEQFAEQHHADCCLALHRNGEPRRYTGITLDDKGHVLAFAHASADARAWINGGVYWMRRACLEALAHRAGQALSLEQQLLPQWLDSGLNVLGFVASGRFIDIGVPHDYQRASALINAPR
ncbi:MULTISPECIES: nucleotidyltransferase family protein [unclassified Pseudomonas]|uniref:nucleotidyltransferase family protein n=1 Tax=unclassified Pseudomonas TaxID=196821 RepID=UPI0020980F2D|nr:MULTISPECIES: nucleotidyltransferase family protein [unclassified Pseudomonas]MCO7519090.1 nucleotidyltransferase family protein [Pseudomonas sp. 1]MCO7539885.1 nucleotidyltransferase family protein [Pseudomonas sp. VA159-2]